jgi:polar amino acid transport system substrate-binding protein
VIATPVGDPEKGWIDCDNFSVTLTYEDGSVGIINYLSSGDTVYPKERIEIFGGGRVGVIDDFKTTVIAGGSHLVKKKSSQDKGHRDEISAFLDSIQNGKKIPIPVHEILETTELTFAILDSLEAGTVVTM